MTVENSTLEALARNFGRTYYRHEIIFYEGDMGREVYFIVKGSVEITTRYYENELDGVKIPEGGKVHRLSILGKGDVFGEMSILENLPRSATAQALEDTEVIVMNHSDFFLNLDRYPQLAVKVLQLLSSRIRYMDQRLKEILGRTDYLNYQIDALKYQLAAARQTDKPM